MATMFKPFKAPSFVRRTGHIPEDNQSASSSKRQRLENTTSHVSSPFSGGNSVAKADTLPANSRNPLMHISSESSEHIDHALDSGLSIQYGVLWRKPSNKKNKTWDGDGTLRVSGGAAHLYDDSGRPMGKANSVGPLLPGSYLKVGGKEVQVESVKAKATLTSQDSELAGIPYPPIKPALVDANPNFPSTRLPRTSSTSPTDLKPKAAQASWQKPRAVVVQQKPTRGCARRAELINPNILNHPPSNTRAQYKAPFNDDVTVHQLRGSAPAPRHDPGAPDALVMKQPSLRDIPVGKQAIDVVIDPILATKLRPHQREGVKFMYECVMGMRSNLGQGVILADDMGLGKTLQTITLIWTLLKQNPVRETEPVIKKALIVCPVTLIKNWRKEFRKWLGYDRIGVLIAEDKTTRITDFTRGKSYSVMVIGYDRLRSVYEELQKGQVIDLIVADEGHRLKTAQSKSAQAIQSFNTTRRIILSGTPIQNNLGEFFSMVDFVNPGALGSAKRFARDFETPIERSRQPSATPHDIEVGEAKSEELAETTNAFIIRRTADVLAEYLPPKVESVLLCRPTKAQATIYRHVLSSPIFQSALGSAENALQLINILKKVCNSPQLLARGRSTEANKTNSAKSIVLDLPQHLLCNASASTKLQVLDQLLYSINKHTDEKVVIVSNFTSTLNILESLLSSLSMPFLRLDGSTSSSKRQELVDTFNRVDRSICFAFLLSAKAGGMGINLVGASRLVLFDVDWNPAVDAQAMARIHRDGQKRPCFIYRLLVAGALDEKMWQRQVTKLGLASSILESRSGQASFSKEELMDLFRLDTGTKCQTHDLIGCDCGGRRSLAATAEMARRSRQESRQDVGSLVEQEDVLDQGDGMQVSDSDLDLPLPTRKRRRNTSILGEAPQVIKASQLDSTAQEPTARFPQQLEPLMAYNHVEIDGFSSLDDQESMIEDGVLRRILCDEDNLVNFVFSKSTA